LADASYRDEYDAGTDPEEMARSVLEDQGFGVEDE
jgi:hypothetical protein